MQAGGWWRAAQVLGLAFLIGPAADVENAAQAVALAAFAALYLALLPPIAPIARRGSRAIAAGIALLAAIALLSLALGAPQSFVLLLVYVVAAAGLSLPTTAAAAVTIVTAAGVAIGLAVTDADASTVTAYALTILSVGAMLAGLGSSLRANRRLAAAREELARLAVAEERLRIARDLHDLLGHTLSLVALKSELAARLVHSDPARAHDELTDVQAVTRQALADVREAVQGYRRADLVEALDSARDTLEAAGIDCHVDRRPARFPSDVEGVVALAVREAATNVVRHSGASECTITLQVHEDHVALVVTDDGAATTGSAGGTGLEGLAERARRLHGTLEAGARPEGGFGLRLTLPVRAT